MPTSLITRLWSLRHQFARYFIVGVSAFVLDMATLYGLKEYLGFDARLAVAINQIIVLSYIFFLNKLWSFQARGAVAMQVSRYIILSLINYVIAIGWMWIWNKWLGFNYLGVRIANITLSIFWNFLLYKYWVYRQPVTPNP